MVVRFRLYIVWILAIAFILVLGPSHKLLAASGGTSLTTSPVTLGLNVQPGTISTQTLEVMNNTSQPLPIVMAIKTFGAYGVTGEAAITNFQPDDPAASWIHLSPTNFIAQPGVWSKVKATIALPKAANLG